MDNPLDVFEHCDDDDQLQEDLYKDAQRGEEDAQGGEDHQQGGAGDQPGQVGRGNHLQPQPDVGAHEPHRDGVEAEDHVHRAQPVADTGEHLKDNIAVIVILQHKSSLTSLGPT